MEEILARFSQVVEEPYGRLDQWKNETGNKVVGCFPMHVPEEIVHAAGALPVILLGSDDPIPLADEYLQPFVCCLVRSNLHLVMSRKLDFLDSVIIPDICDSVKCVADIPKLHHQGSFYHQLLLPAKLTTPSSLEYLRLQFSRLRYSMEKLAERKIKDEDLGRSIAVYNQHRALLRSLYDLRREKPALISPREMETIVAASMLMPKEEHNNLLAQILEQAQRAEAAPTNNVRVILSGCLCEEPTKGLLDILKECDAVVVDDDLYVGGRYFATPVDEHKNPIEALAERYTNGIPCPTKHEPHKNWGDYLVGLARDSGARGVIIVMLKFCEPHAFDYPLIKQKLGAAGIPHLLIERIHEKVTSGGIRTRVEAFIEMLREE